jgi:hypothetical protein
VGGTGGAVSRFRQMQQRRSPTRKPPPLLYATVRWSPPGPSLYRADQGDPSENRWGGPGCPEGRLVLLRISRRFRDGSCNRRMREHRYRAADNGDPDDQTDQTRSERARTLRFEGH